MGACHSFRGTDGKLNYFISQDKTDKYSVMIGKLLSPRGGGQSWSDVKKMSLREAASVSDCLSLFDREVYKEQKHAEAMKAAKAKIGG